MQGRRALGARLGRRGEEGRASWTRLCFGNCGQSQSLSEPRERFRQPAFPGTGSAASGRELPRPWRPRPARATLPGRSRPGGGGGPAKSSWDKKSQGPRGRKTLGAGPVSTGDACGSSASRFPVSPRFPYAHAVCSCPRSHCEALGVRSGRGKALSGPSELGPACRLAGPQARQSQGPPPLCLPHGAAHRGVNAQAPGPALAFQTGMRRPGPRGAAPGTQHRS